MCTIGYFGEECLVESIKRKFRRFLPECDFVYIHVENDNNILILDSIIIDNSYCKKRLKMNGFHFSDCIKEKFPRMKTHILVEFPSLYKEEYNMYNIYPDDIFDTEGDDPERKFQLIMFFERLKSRI